MIDGEKNKEAVTLLFFKLFVWALLASSEFPECSLERPKDSLHPFLPCRGAPSTHS